MKVLITGASSGIGLAITREYINHGWDVIAQFNKNSNELSLIGKECPNRVTIVKMDFSQECDLEDILRPHLLESIDVDAFVNCVGLYETLKFKELNSSVILRHLKVNVISGLLIQKALLANMKKNSWGRIVNIGSIGIKYGGGASYPYSLSKYAQEFIAADYKEWALSNIFINTIRAGVVNTKIHNLDPNKNMEDRLAKIPIGRMCQPEEIAKMAYYLGSNENTVITGQTIAVTGGE